MAKTFFRIITVSLLTVLLLGSLTQPVMARSSLSMSSLFTDNMVLQANDPVIFGSSRPGSVVKVTFAHQVCETKADVNGNWNVHLAPLHYGATGDLRIDGDKTVILKNVVAGEVWLCAGQSNMGFPINKGLNGAFIVKQIHDADVRFFVVPVDQSIAPLKKVGSHWTSSRDPGVDTNSALASEFACLLHQKLHAPIGVIVSSYGGSSITTWLNQESLDSDQALAQKLQVRANTPAAFLQLQLKQNFEKRKRAAFNSGPTGYTFGQPLVPCTVYNAMIAPLTGFPIRGVVWYQGEADAEQANLYRVLLSLLINGWRDKWNNSDLPFVLVQLPNFASAPGCKPTLNSWAELRHAQSQALKIRKTSMVVAIDQGKSDNLHPPDKSVVAQRLVNVALSRVYQKNVQWSGPTISKAMLTPNKILCEFDHCETLVAKNGLRGSFEVAGLDKKFVPVDAAVEGRKIILRGKEITGARFVRYAWSNDPKNLFYNEHGLPGAPFEVSTH